MKMGMLHKKGGRTLYLDGFISHRISQRQERDGQREHDGGVVFLRNRGKGLQVTQLHGGIVLGHVVGSLRFKIKKKKNQTCRQKKKKNSCNLRHLIQTETSQGKRLHI